MTTQRSCEARRVHCLAGRAEPAENRGHSTQYVEYLATRSPSAIANPPGLMGNRPAEDRNDRQQDDA